MFTTIIFDPTTGLGVGRALYTQHAPTLGTNEVACTQAQYETFNQWKLVSGAIVAATAADLAPSKAQLTTYANAKQAALRDGGITVNVGTASTPDEVDVASDVSGRSLVSGCVQLIGLASSNGQPAPTFPWINDGGAQLTLTGAQMMTIGLALGNFVQATYAALGTVLAAIANGSITTTAGIDAAAWPSTSL